VYIVVDVEGHKLASFAEVTEATRVSRTLDGAVAVLNAEGTVLARVVSGTGGGGDRAARAALKWQEHRRRKPARPRQP
jgi:hypothetical protein